MKRYLCSHLLLLTFTLTATRLLSQTGPFDSESWPATRKPDKAVHYVVTDGGLTPPSDRWVADHLMILSGGDQVTDEITIGGHTGKKVLGTYLNVADNGFAEWADDETIDVLIQAYGDAALFAGDGQPRDFRFLIGTLPVGPPAYLDFPLGGQVPAEAKNRKWNWILFRIPNGLRPDGARFVGPPAAEAQGATTFGGVNGGTIRFEGVAGLTVRVVAFGEVGAFGEPEAINKFASADSCDPEPNTNLAGLDVSLNTANKLEVLNHGDQTVTFVDNLGPTDDKRRAVLPTGQYLNFGILDHYLGKPCNDPRVVKICLDFYDDPALAGAKFGPEAYATDDKGGVANYPADKRHVLAGTGKWIRRSWTVPNVNLFGVNAGAGRTAGPRFISEGGQVAVSRCELAVLRTGSHPLAGQDPLANCYEDLNICAGTYGSFAELDLAKDVKNGLAVGSSGGDQEMIVAEAGPTNDRRMAVRPARDDGSPGFGHTYLNFALNDEVLGPSSQPPAQMAICATYYDDPALVGKRIKPEVYITERNGLNNFAFTPDSFWVVLEGTGQWRDAYWELPDVKFNGVNQGPQAAARFAADDKIFVSRLRYAVIRPCGPNAGVNALSACKPVPADVALSWQRQANNQLRLSWPTSASGYVLQASPALGAGAAWQAVAGATVDGDRNVVAVAIEGTRFYRLAK